MLSIAKEVAALERMTMKELKSRYAEVFGEETSANHKKWLIKRVVWRLQAMAEGDLSERARQRATELANDADLRLSPPKLAATTPAPEPTLTIVQRQGDVRLPIAGTIITRLYKGRT